MMLRECIKQESLAKIILYSDVPPCNVPRRSSRAWVSWNTLIGRPLASLPRLQELFDEFFDYVQNSQFDVAADAFSTFRVRRPGMLHFFYAFFHAAPELTLCFPPLLQDLLTKNKIICSKFLEEKFDKVRAAADSASSSFVTGFSFYSPRLLFLFLFLSLPTSDLLQVRPAAQLGELRDAPAKSEAARYGACRGRAGRRPCKTPPGNGMNPPSPLIPQGELLLDRTNFTVMTRYISNPENLKLMMNMLRDSSRNIQFEAFHVFKVFVANPDKPAAIHSILSKNKEKVWAERAGMGRPREKGEGDGGFFFPVKECYSHYPPSTTARQVLERFSQRPGRRRAVHGRKGVCNQADQRAQVKAASLPHVVIWAEHCDAVAAPPLSRNLR